MTKLFKNILVLDEPTNDLDIETLELLEDILIKFEGTILLVSHDRKFMDNVITSLMVFEANGKISEYVGGYSDWSIKGGKLLKVGDSNVKTDKARGKNLTQENQRKHGTTKRKSREHDKEISRILLLIEKLELEQSELEKILSGPNFYEDSKENIERTLKKFTENKKDLEITYERWEQLDYED